MSDEEKGRVAKKIQEKLEETGEAVSEVVEAAKESVSQAEQAMEKANGLLARGGRCRPPVSAWLFLYRMLLVGLVHSVFAASAGSQCVVQGCLLPRPSGGDDVCINEVLSQANEVFLCPGAQYRLSGTIVLPRNGAKISTLGRPERWQDRALLLVNGRFATAINGRGRSNVEISYVRIDGGSLVFGNSNPDREALVRLGGLDVAGIRVEAVELRNPQGWSCLHLFEGSRDAQGFGRCYNAVVANNWIHDAGLPFDNLWADGISMGCEGEVLGNRVVNVTDVGIVLFVNGVRVESNIIRNDKTLAFGAISMGAYHNQVIKNNRIIQGMAYASVSDVDREATDLREAPICPPDGCWPPEDGGRFDVGIAVGRPIWSHCNGTFSDASGTVISGNVLSSASYSAKFGGYGIAIARVSNVVVSGNSATYVPTGRGSGCAGNVPDAAKAFQFMECSNCALQADFLPANSLWNLLGRR